MDWRTEKRASLVTWIFENQSRTTDPVVLIILALLFQSKHVLVFYFEIKGKAKINHVNTPKRKFNIFCTNQIKAFLLISEMCIYYKCKK